VRGAGNDIDAKGAVALAAALQGNTTLQTLDLFCMWTARCAYFAGMGGSSGDLASARAGMRERLVGVVGTASASAGSEHGVVGGADNGIDAEGAVALAAALQGNTTLQTLNLSGMWTARCAYFAGMGRQLRGPRECASGEARPARGVVGTASASAGSAHGVVGGADNGIHAEGAVALAAALQGNTTLQTLFLSCMWTAHCVYFAGMGRPLRGPRECAGGDARAAGGCGRRGVRECGQ
jgi:hypothetical protein